MTDTKSGLAQYLVHKKEALAKTAASLPSGDSARETISAESFASDLTGVRRIKIRDFQILSDSGAGFGGYNLGPSSPELLLGVLASCLTHTYLIGAARQGIALDSVHVRFEAQNNDARFLGLETADPDVPFNIRARVEVRSDADRDAIAALHEFAARYCPLNKIMREPQTITIEGVGP